MMLLKLVLIIAIMAVVMIVVMIPGVFAVQDNVTIEGNLDPVNRTEEKYVVHMPSSNEHRDIVFSIYDSGNIIFSQETYVRPGSERAIFTVNFFPPLFQDNTIYTIDVKGPGLIGRELITINEGFTSYQSQQLPNVEPDATPEAKTSDDREAEKKAAEQRAAEKKAAEQRAAEKKAAEQRAAEQRAAEQRAAEQRAEAAIRAAEAKAAQDTSNFLIIAGAAIAIISLLVIVKKMKNKKSTSNASQRTTTNPYSPPNPPSTNTESSTMFFYECPRCHSADIQNNPDGSVNCPDCGYRG